MKVVSRVVSVVALLIAVLVGLMAALLHDNDLTLYREVGHALSYIGIIFFCLYLAFELLRKDD